MLSLVIHLRLCELKLYLKFTYPIPFLLCLPSVSGIILSIGNLHYEKQVLCRCLNLSSPVIV